MAMMMSTTCSSPSSKENEKDLFMKNDIVNRNSPFTAILMELAKEDNCDTFLPGGRESPVTTIIENDDTFNHDRNPTHWEMYDASTSLINHEGLSASERNEVYGAVSDGNQIYDASCQKNKRRKINQDPEVVIPLHNISAEQQAETYLLETMGNLKRRLSSSQMQLELFTSQLGNDLPSFVTRAIKIFSLNSATLYESSPASFYLDQRMFVDQAVSIYFQQLKPNCGSSEATLEPSINCHFPDQSSQTLPVKSVCSSPLLCPNNYTEWMSNDYDDDIRNAYAPYGSVSKNVTVTLDDNATILPFSAVKIRSMAPAKSHTPVSPIDLKANHARHLGVRYGIPIPFGPT